MHDSSQRCSGSLSRGAAWIRVVAAVAVLGALVFACSRLFRTREARLWDFVADARSAALDLKEDEFFACIDPAVVYREKSDLAAMQRDWKRWKTAGIGTAAVTRQEATLDDSGADVAMTVVLTVGIQPVAEVRVRLRAEDPDGKWKVVRLDWQ
jgi:hypothetical protein